MPRTRKGGGKIPLSQGVKDTQSDIKLLRDRARELLRKANKSVREVRHDVSQLRKAGIVSHRIHANRYIPTRYMLRKIEKNRDVLSGTAITVIPKNKKERETARRYAEAGIFEKRGSVLVVPAEHKEDKAKIRRGAIEIRRRLRNGEMRQLVLPYQPKDMAGLVEDLKRDASLNGRKEPDEFFAFFLGRGSSRAFVDNQELIDEIETKYQHLFSSNRRSRDAFKHFMLVRFKPEEELRVPYAPGNVEPWTGGSAKHRRGRDYNATGRNDGRVGTYEQRQKERAASRKAERRKNETEAQRKKRLDYQRNYKANRSKDK